jgi:triphosphoribosyl-dephospho-CoA synthase
LRRSNRSISALRPYFPTIAALGAANAPWRSLQSHAQAAEAVMLRATGGVNTHRGAIFHLGLLCAAAGALDARNGVVSPRAVCGFVRVAYAPHLIATRTVSSHGSVVERRYGASGARGEAGSGYRSVRRWSLPAFDMVLARTRDRERAAVQALFALVANVGDTQSAVARRLRRSCFRAGPRAAVSRSRRRARARLARACPPRCIANSSRGG